MQVRTLQCALARYLQDLVSSNAVTFVITQHTGFQDGATPTLLLMKDLIVQVSWPHRHHNDFLHSSIMLDVSKNSIYGT